MASPTLLMLLSLSLLSQDTATIRVWKQECMPCHAMTLPWDLRHFKFSDFDIIRRSLPHVDQMRASQIVALVKTLPVADTMTPKKIPFQPLGVVLASDAEFGIKLFGSDQWPATLTRTQLLSQDPTKVAIALALPEWSNENSVYDWLPGSLTAGRLPQGIVNASKTWGDRYEANPTMVNAVSYARRIRNVAHDTIIPDAPCTYSQNLARYDAQKCGDVGEWTASFLYGALIRSGNIHGNVVAVTDDWWETGHLYHKAQQFRRPLPARDTLIAGWMHLGWMWKRALSKKASYEAGPLNKIGLARHASWIVLRTMVERPARHVDVCGDVHTLGNDGSTLWMKNALSFGYNELRYRAPRSMLPTNKAACSESVRQAQLAIGRRMGAVFQASMQPLADSTRVAIMNSN